MATVSAKVYEHHKKADGTYNVKIRVYHKEEKKFIDTPHFLSLKQLTKVKGKKEFNIKDPFVLDIVDKKLKDYRKTISELEEKLEFFTAESLRDYLKNKHEEIDFIKFCGNYIQQEKDDGRDGSAANHRAVRNHLIDFFKRESVSINEIHYNMLVQFERYLKSERTITRINQLGKPVTTISKPVSETSLYNYMRDLRTLFNAALDHYNNEDLGIILIKHYPFKKYKVGSAPLTENRNNNLEEVIRIRDCEVLPNSRAELARDLYMLSFYLCGMNAVDLFKITENDVRNGRLDYNRSKTKGKRKDKAFISIKIIDEAKPLLKKYIGKLSERYSSRTTFNSSLKHGMKKLRELSGVDSVTLYCARHTFANTARNDCRMSKDDVALALNHVENGNRVTDIYIAKDWRIIDDVQHKVMQFLRKSEPKIMEMIRKKEIVKQKVA
ncbi:site-specific integrase [Sphingobacterium sp.]|uniref:site-specific integrase n=1 Tax=Sphingobacterium sp. TaxID=341027 RepID=UPI0031DB0800